MTTQIALNIIPAALDTPEFREAWAEWLAERGPRYTYRARAMALKKMAPWGAAEATAALEHSLASGYRGIFPAPKAPTQSKAPGPQPSTQPSTWAIQKKIDEVDTRIRQLRNRSPGEHCRLSDFLTDAELQELSDLTRRRADLRNHLLNS